MFDLRCQISISGGGGSTSGGRDIWQPNWMRRLAFKGKMA
jgi:hypothetical protein